MPDEIMQAWEAMPQETKDRLSEWAKHIMEVLTKAAQAIIKAITEAFKRFIDAIVPALPPRYKAKIEAVKVEWRARGPRRNRALICLVALLIVSCIVFLD